MSCAWLVGCFCVATFCVAFVLGGEFVRKRIVTGTPRRKFIEEALRIWQEASTANDADLRAMRPKFATAKDVLLNTWSIKELNERIAP